MNEQQFNREFRQACMGNCADDVKHLLSIKPEALHMQTPFGTWLHVAAEAGAIDVVALFLELGLDPNARGGTFKGNALQEAARGGHLNVAELLRNAGAIIDTSEPERNPLFGAIFHGRMEIVAWLVAAGVDFRISYTGENMKGMDAIAFAKERGQSEIAHYLEQLVRAA